MQRWRLAREGVDCRERSTLSTKREHCPSRHRSSKQLLLMGLHWTQGMSGGDSPENLPYMLQLLA